MQAERKIQVLEKENTELKEEIEQLKTKCVQFEVLNATILQCLSLFNINLNIKNSGVLYFQIFNFTGLL